MQIACVKTYLVKVSLNQRLVKNQRRYTRVAVVKSQTSVLITLKQRAYQVSRQYLESGHQNGGDYSIKYLLKVAPSDIQITREISVNIVIIEAL